MSEATGLSNRRVAVYVDASYQELEVWYPYFRLQEAGVETILVGFEAGKTYPSKFGYPAVAQKSYDQLRPSDYDGVVVPGGYAPDHMRRHARATQFVRELDAQGKLVASICHGPWVLCSAGVLKDRRATCFFAIKDDVINAGAKYEDSEVVVDGNLVTARKPEDLPAFCRSLLAVLAQGPARG